MRAALVGASDFNVAHFMRQRFEYVVAVDGGYASLQAAGVAPHAVVGDFDSLGYAPGGGDAPACAAAGAPEVLDVRRYPPEKDESDMELAFRVAAEQGCRTAVLYGALGRRFDHTLANLQVMLHQARQGRCVLAVGDDYAVALLHGTPGHPAALRFAAIPPQALKAGSYRNFVSVFALGGPAAGVSQSGLKYRLNAATVPDDVSLGLSNEFAGQAACIEVADGSLVVSFPLAAWDYLRA